MSYTDEAIKKAVEALRENHLVEYKTKLKPTHAHEIVSACFGYNSKKGLKSDDYFTLDPDEPETFELSGGHENIKNRIEKLKGLDVDESFSRQVEKIIFSTIKPECSICGYDHESVVAAETDNNNPEQLWVCYSCVRKEEEVGHCRFCGEDMVYPIEMLNNNWECPEHVGEGELSPEDEEGWRHNVQKWSEM